MATWASHKDLVSETPYIYISVFEYINNIYIYIDMSYIKVS